MESQHAPPKAWLVIKRALGTQAGPKHCNVFEAGLTPSKFIAMSFGQTTNVSAAAVSVVGKSGSLMHI